MTKFIIVVLLYLPFTNFAQLYENASNNLPDNGAKGSSMDVRAADLDSDGDLDIVLANEAQPNTILLNDGLGVFVNVSSTSLPQEGHDSEDVTIADFNGDTYLDLVFCSEDDINFGATDVHEYYLGNEAGNFDNTTQELIDSEANAVISADIDGDGSIDLLFGNAGNNNLLLNNGSGQFELDSERLPQVFRTTQDLGLADLDNDGDLDLFEANEDGNLLHINDGNGFFSDETDSRLPQGLNIESRKVSFGDIDGDDDLDIFLSNVEFIPGKNRQNRLFINDGEGVFTDVTSTQLPSDFDLSLDAIFEDIDFDDDLDIIISNIFGGHIKVYQNDGSGVFSDATLDVFGDLYFRDALGVISEDFTGDGLNDLYICDRNNPNGNYKDLLLIRNPISKVEDELTNNIIISPNPAKDIINLSFPDKIPYKILVSDSSGQVFQSLATDSNSKFKLDLELLPRGSYLIIAQFENEENLVRKVILE